MIEISILELLYLVLTFFLVIIWTLLALVLLRLLKILKVWVELAEYYENMKQVIIYYSMVPYVIKDRIFEYFASWQDLWEIESNKSQKNPTSK